MERPQRRPPSRAENRRFSVQIIHRLADIELPGVLRLFDLGRQVEEASYFFGTLAFFAFFAFFGISVFFRRMILDMKLPALVGL